MAKQDNKGIDNSAIPGLVKIKMTARGDINAKLYAKYNLAEDEIAFFELMIKPIN